MNIVFPSNHNDLKEFLDEKYLLFNQLSFIETDPISIPHSFKKQEDIEISAFLTALISWGNRKSILNNAKQMMELLDNSPHDFIVNHQDDDLKKLLPFVHRTFNGFDLTTMVSCLHSIYKTGEGLELLFSEDDDLETGLGNFPGRFFKGLDAGRTKKHIANIHSGSAAKRINMFLRWMVRKDESGVDFGIWKSLKSSQLYIPLDVHSGRTARLLGLMERKQNDWKSVVVLTQTLKEFDPIDPVKYDFALFGLSVVS